MEKRILLLAALAVDFLLSVLPGTAGQGPTVVLNGKRPAIEAKADLLLKEELTIGKEADARGILFEDPACLTVGDDGRIYIADRKAGHIKVFDPGGTFLHCIARSGQGPGEIGYIRDISFTPDQKIMVNDTRSKRLHFFDPEGDFKRALPASGTIGFENPSQDMKGRIFAVQTSILKDKSFSELTEFTPEMKKVRTIFSIQTDQYPNFNPVGPRVRYHLEADGGLAWGVTSRYEIHLLDASGRPVKTIRKEYNPLPVTKEYRDRVLKETRLDGKYVKFSDDLPAFMDFQRDDDGRLYVRLYETAPDESGHVFDVFDSEGRYAARIVIKGTHMPVFRKGRVYTIEQAVDGTPFVRVYSVSWKKSAS